jgi:hypothetical protein
LDSTPDEILGGLDRFPAHMRAMVKNAVAALPAKKTFRQMPKAGPEAEAIATIWGHIKSVGPTQIVRFKESSKPRDPEKSRRRLKILEDFKEQTKALLSMKVSVPPPEIQWSRTPSSRAYYSPQRHLIAMPASDRNIDAFTLAHEFWHSVEEKNPARGEAAIDFLAHRTAGESPRSLRSLGKPWLPFSERARPDKFLDAYVGKAYEVPGKVFATEVTSMGAQWLVKSPGWFWENDREHFLFTLGQFAGW